VVGEQAGLDALGTFADGDGVLGAFVVVAVGDAHGLAAGGATEDVAAAEGLMPLEGCRRHLCRDAAG
jgi:hypothetical protein